MNVHNKLKLLILFYIFVTNILFSQEAEEVRITNNIINFLDNKTKIQLGENDYCYVFTKQNRLVCIWKQMKSNYMEYTLEFYDFYGKNISRSEILEGEMRFIFAENCKRVLAGQLAVLTRQNKSYLYDLDGKLLNILIHDYGTKLIGITDDEKYFWFVASKMRPLNPGEKPLYPYLKSFLYNHIMIFDSFTGAFLEEYSTIEPNFYFTINGKKYTIIIGLPDIPN